MFAASTLALLLAAPPAETYSLQWKLKEGDVFYNKGTVVMAQTIEVMGRTVEQKIETSTVLRFKVKSVMPNGTVVEMTFLETKFDAQGFPAGGNIGEKFKGLTFTATLDDKLKVTRLEGYDKFLDAVTDGDKTQKKLIKAVMPESALRRSFDQTFLFVPSKPVAVGDKWERSEKMSLGPLGEMDMKFACKLDSVQGTVASIAMKGDMTWKEGEASDDLPFKLSKVDLKAEKLTSTYQFDIKTGRPLESKFEMDMSGTMTIDVNGMSLDMKVKQKMTATGTITTKNPIKD